MEHTASPLNARDVLLEVQLQLGQLPGARPIRRDGGFYALIRAGLYRNRPSQHDHYALYPELHVVDASDGSICVVGYGHVFNGMGEATGRGRFTAIPFAPATPVADGVLSAYVAGEISDTDRYAVLLEHTAEGSIRIHPGHKWNGRACTELLGKPLSDQAFMAADNFIRYAPRVVGIITEALRVFTAGSKA